MRTVWYLGCYDSVRIGFQRPPSVRKVVNELAESSSERFAVIESRWTDRRPDRFVLAYHDEESLRELIAAPSIVGVGFNSRGDAIKRIEACFSAATPWHDVQKAIPGDRAEHDQRGSHVSPQRLNGHICSAGVRGIVRLVVSQTVAAAILAFYSNNAVGACIRSFIGA
jgi:hypothetical protein